MTNITLGRLIEWLNTLPTSKRIKHGFGTGDSYRGYYEQLAFEPEDDTTIGEMLASAQFALGREYQGYKGGEFMMSSYTEVWIGSYGTTCDSSAITEHTLKLWEAQ
jgi:hypothetical protein